MEEALAHPDACLQAVHEPRYLAFLASAWDEWLATGNEGDAFPSVWAIRGMRSDVIPDNFAARLGLFSFDTGTPLTAGTWAAARAGADRPLSAAAWIASGERSVFALTRPPGHHAGPSFFGGYCFLNNAAIAAQALRDRGAARVAILDVDFHHGNGTQEIFYRRNDVLFASIHGDPRTEYPFFLGYADEQGEGPGAGFNLNLPLPAKAAVADWFTALETALARINGFAPEALVVSLGVDAFAGDPISKFLLQTVDYQRLGERLAKMGLPCLFVLEGGYAVAEMGANVAAVLEGFEG
ncbi:histone deacetylase family protein [Uliginosibacterium gangwonense]|uniref:histone deacetylase family protein n=1 Tax=Uliginosibacterium gangwonense TaxID=392736 RepID=UPI000378E40C|nr:histone deacetylase family protein [Uliginosibacterium gangwonense]